ncbi:predicted protein [Chaetoceros tenuissimus]|uniref:Uncharacterized protein n=1 Tax=Chaetoceros tenuissimus TaxID=426638 RepID=A0AAD3HCF1_9STRA|nr:predicted protein [Chaetoceros tenuissimus]
MDSTNPNSLRDCHCSWEKGKELRTLFTKEKNECFGKGCFQLKFHKANDNPKTLHLTPQQYQIFVYVCTNIAIDKSILKFSDDEYFRLSVARHRWDRTAEVVKRFRFDKRWHFDKPDSHGRILRKYFIPPNHPHSEILEYAKVEYNMVTMELYKNLTRRPHRIRVVFLLSHLKIALAIKKVQGKGGSKIENERVTKMKSYEF